MAAAYKVRLGGALFAIEVLFGTYVQGGAAFHDSITLAVGSRGGTDSWSSFGCVRRFIGWSETGKPKAYMVIVAPICGVYRLKLGVYSLSGDFWKRKNVAQEAFGSQLGTGLLCWLLILRPLATAMCLKSGAPGGLFTPTMTFGALLGGLLGEGWSYFAPTTSKDSYAIVGAGAMSASASQGLLSSVVFMLELP